MSETAEMYQAIAEHRKALRAKFGIQCPKCKIHRPKTNATILLPQQRCRVDKYIDPRPELTNDEWNSV